MIIYRNRFYRLETVEIISTSYKDMFGMNGLESVEIIKYKRLTDVIGSKSESVYETTLAQFEETYISIEDERDEKLKSLGL